MWYRHLILAIVVLAVLFFSLQGRFIHVPIETFPRFDLIDLKGRHVDETVLSDGGIIHFFRSTCGYCLLEYDDWIQFKKEHPQVLLIAVLHQQSLDEIQVFFSTHENPFDHVLSDDSNILWDQMAVTTVPTTFVIDSDGVIQEHFGYMRALAFESLRKRVKGSKIGSLKPEQNLRDVPEQVGV